MCILVGYTLPTWLRLINKAAQLLETDLLSHFDRLFPIKSSETSQAMRADLCLTINEVLCFGVPQYEYPIHCARISNQCIFQLGKKPLDLCNPTIRGMVMNNIGNIHN